MRAVGRLVFLRGIPVARVVDDVVRRRDVDTEADRDGRKDDNSESRLAWNAAIRFWRLATCFDDAEASPLIMSGATPQVSSM